MSEPRDRGETALLADDDELSREFLAEAFTALGLQVTAVADGEAACDALGREPFDYVFSDLRMPRRDGLAVLAAAKQSDAHRPVVLVTAHGTLEVAVRALREGADDILEKPVSPGDLELCLHRLRDRRRLLAENRYLRAQTVGEELLVASAAMKRVVDMVERVAASRATVLIGGESGTGKERVAALVHRRSDRHAGPFVKVNCAAVPEALAESEFFGHEPGAFTGAAGRREGRFELADGGTLFLDEVGDMSLVLQAKLLRVLQEGELTRVGGNRPRRVDVRLVAATNRDLGEDVRSGRFREDLFYRLSVVPIELPPLRHRPDDILPLARHFLLRDVRLTQDAEALLQQHSWPGNVRELQNVVQRASLLCDHGVIDREVLTPALGTPSLQPAGPRQAGRLIDPAELVPFDPIQNLVGRALRDVETDLIRATLTHFEGNRTRTAATLGIAVRTLFNRLREPEPTPH
ncbi:MAG: sigma-54 dependent transcriptional regulator [Planctomycetota bacterium]